MHHSQYIERNNRNNRENHLNRACRFGEVLRYATIFKILYK